MTIDEKIVLIKQVGEEVVTEDDLKKLLETEPNIIAYDGFEPSGQMHIAQGLLRAININKVISTGVKFKMLVADWHALANNKMGGNLEKIQTVGRYFIETWKACGMNMDKVEFVWASDLAKDPNYWMLVLKIAKTNSIRRFVRTAEIMGRAESLDDLTAAQILYPCMQAADIFYLNAQIAQLGMDQRKVNMLAREIAAQLGYKKPISVSHHMLMGLMQPPVTTDDKTSRTIELKMSKSKPDSAIFMTDIKEDIERKITKAWCPEGIVEENPILEYFKYIIFESLDRLNIDKLTIERPEKFGGPVILNSFQDLEQKFGAKEIHPTDLKNTLIPLLDKLIEPVRLHFETDKNARKLLERVRSFAVTR
ncbi:tyrosine--tRNA ligase [Candidatus Roizmanbacteria bacterium RIFCSPLOWO2_01_FULL_39_19]|nr:MAG: tyrosine--tRNA ligase [Candidatus Roizmanbacteria bacterium RIFCSPLOWO2_01_FULL_39_19]